MSATALSYLQILIGFVGILLTLLNIRRILPEFEFLAEHKVAPDELRNLSSFLRILMVLILVVFLFFLCAMGLVVILAQMFVAFGAQQPFLTSTLAIGSLIALCTSVALAILKMNYWIPGTMATFGLGFASLNAALDPEPGVIWPPLALFSFMFFISGFFCLMKNSDIQWT